MSADHIHGINQFNNPFCRKKWCLLIEWYIQMSLIQFLFEIERHRVRGPELLIC